MSGATTRSPAAASPVSWWRQVHQNCGKPCSSRTSGPSPASAACNRTPLAETSRCAQGPGSRTLVASGCPSWGSVMQGSAQAGVRVLADDLAVPDDGQVVLPLTGCLAAGQVGQVRQRLDGLLRLLDLLHLPVADEPGDRGDEDEQGEDDEVG